MEEKYLVISLSGSQYLFIYIQNLSSSHELTWHPLVEKIHEERSILKNKLNWNNKQRLDQQNEMEEKSLVISLSGSQCPDLTHLIFSFSLRFSLRKAEQCMARGNKDSSDDLAYEVVIVLEMEEEKTRIVL